MEANLFKRSRLKLGLTQHKLSQITGISNATIVALEKGEKRQYQPKVLNKICTVLNIELKNAVDETLRF